MFQKVHFIGIFMLCALSMQAQKQLVIEDVANRALYPTFLSQLSFRGESDTYAYVDKDRKTLIQGSAKKVEEPLLKFEDFTAALKAAGATEMANLPAITWKDENNFTFSDDQNLWQYDINAKKASKIGNWNPLGENQDFAANGNVAYTLEGDLYVCVSKELKIKPVTTDGEYQIVYGEAAHRSEFGITKGTFWSPTGAKLAFYRIDQSGVTDYPLANYQEKPAANKNIKYPMAGTTSQNVTLGVYDIKTEKTIYLKTGEPKEQYLTNITWSPDEKFIYIAVVNRDQNEMKLNRYSATSGELDKTLFVEKNEKYTEPEHGVYFIPEKNTRFAWLGEADNWQHIYIYDLDGKQIKQLTKGEWMVEDILGFDKKGEYVYFSATKDGAISLHTYRVKIETGEMTLISPNEGYHATQVSKSGNYLIDSYSNLTTPNVTLFTDASNGKAIRTLNTSPDPFKDYKIGQVSFFPIKSTDKSTDLYCRLIKPVDFDPAKKYPVMYYVYGGPHVQLIHNTWLAGADMFMMYMASQGYVVFTLDNRGSGGRGLAFEQATHRQLGTVELEDQMAGIEWLKKQSFVDTEKMGCFGWSFGGFMTTSLMLRKPGTFQAAVAGGPVIDWKFYEIMYTERYMDTPEQNPDGYKTASLLNYVPNLKGRLMVIHGLQDDVVVPQNTAAFVNECIAKGVLIDYFPYPNHPHNVRGKDRIHLYKKVEDYFKQNLK